MQSINGRKAGAALLALALAFLAGPVLAQKVVAHSEACDHNGWGFLTFSSHHYGTTNTCRKTIAIWFMTKSGQVMHADVMPGAVFDTGLVASDEFTGDVWVAASCPFGYEPSPLPSSDDWDTILHSQYRCLKK